MIELIGKRTASSKTFDLGNGIKLWQGTIGDIHYKDNYADPNEPWKDIDLTWQNNKITRAPYELTREGNKITVRDKKTGEISTIELLEVRVGAPSKLPIEEPPAFEIIPEFTRVRFRHTITPDKLPFEARFKVTGKIPLQTHAFDDGGELQLETTLDGDILTEKLSEIKDKKTGKLRPARGLIKIDPTLNLQVAASANDDQVRRSDEKWWNTSSYFGAGHWFPNENKLGASARFTNVTIPKGSTIHNAYLQLRALDSRSVTVVRTRLCLNDHDNAPQITSYSDHINRARTTDVLWDNIPAWTAGTWYNSPSITSQVQTVINRPGWQEGNALIVFWEDRDGRSDAVNNNVRLAYSFDGGSASAPKLIIEYSALYLASATLSGVGTLSTTGSRIFSRNATLSGSGNLSAFLARLVSSQALLSGIGNLSAWSGVWIGRATLTGAGFLSATCRLIRKGKAILSGSGNLIAAGRSNPPSKATLSGSGNLTSRGWLTLAAKATLSGTATLTALSTHRPTLIGMRLRVRRDLKDEDPANYRWSDAEIDRAISRAVREFSSHLPLEMKTSLPTTPGSRWLDISSLTDRVSINFIEYPINKHPRCFRSFMVHPDLNKLYIDHPFDPSERDTTPDGSSCYVYWGKLHTLDITTSTIPPQYEDLIALGACAYAIIARTQFLAERDPYNRESRDLVWGQDRLRQFHKELKQLSRHRKLKTGTLYA